MFRNIAPQIDLLVCFIDSHSRPALRLTKISNWRSPNWRRSAQWLIRGQHSHNALQELTKLGDVDVCGFCAMLKASTNIKQVYIAKPADYPHSPSKLLLLLTGGTGLKSANNQLQADKYASEGFLVIMPDQWVLLDKTYYAAEC
jgi:hypothetical protein